MIRFHINVWCAFGRAVVVTFFNRLQINLINPIAIWKVFRNKDKYWTSTAWIDAFGHNIRWITKKDRKLLPHHPACWHGTLLQDLFKK